MLRDTGKYGQRGKNTYFGDVDNCCLEHESSGIDKLISWWAPL